MATYYKITVVATMKIQDPAPSIGEIEELKEDIYLYCPHELVEEQYEIELIDAD